MPRKKSKTEKQRLSLSTTVEFRKLLESVKDEYQYESITTVIRQGVRLLGMCRRELKKGNTIWIHDDVKNEERQIILL